MLDLVGVLAEGNHTVSGKIAKRALARSTHHTYKGLFMEE